MARSAPSARELELSPTVDGVRLELRDAGVPPAEIVTRILEAAATRRREPDDSFERIGAAPRVVSPKDESRVDRRRRVMACVGGSAAWQAAVGGRSQPEGGREGVVLPCPAKSRTDVLIEAE
jgi:hypothetical protein